MEEMTFKEKVLLLENLKEQASEGLERTISGGQVYQDVETGRISVRMDLREAVRQTLAREHVSQSRLASAMGIHVAALNNYLSGFRALPYNQIEEILWLMKGTMIDTEEGSQENMTLMQKTGVLEGLDTSELLDVQNMITGGVVMPDYKKDRLSIRWDLRTELKTIMDEQGVTQAGLGRTIGVTKSTMHDYLTGRIGLPYNQLEEVLWLLDGTMTKQ